MGIMADIMEARSGVIMIMKKMGSGGSEGVMVGVMTMGLDILGLDSGVMGGIMTTSEALKRNIR